MSQKHQQRTRAEKLARREAPQGRRRYVVSASVFRAAHSSRKPHQGAKEKAKVYEEVVNRWTGHTTIRRVV